MSRYTVDVQENEQGQFLELPEALLKETGWKEGDVLKWIDNKDGSYSIEKVDAPIEKEYVLVETMSVYRMRYVVEVPKGHAEWAEDTVVLEEAIEFSQKHIGENILSHRVLTTEEVVKLFKSDNDYLSSRDDESIIEKWVTKIDKEGQVINYT